MCVGTSEGGDMELEERLARVEHKVAVLEGQEWTSQTCEKCKHLFTNTEADYGICSKKGNEPNTPIRGSACSHWLQIPEVVVIEEEEE